MVSGSAAIDRLGGRSGQLPLARSVARVYFLPLDGRWRFDTREICAAIRFRFLRERVGFGIAKIRESGNLNLNKVGIWWRSD